MSNHWLMFGSLLSFSRQEPLWSQSLATYKETLRGKLRYSSALAIVSWRDPSREITALQIGENQFPT